MKKVLLTTVLLLIGTMAFAQERIAVFPFEDMDNVFTGSQSFLFYDEFSNEFAKISAGRFTIVDRQNVEKLFNMEAAFQLSDFSSREKTAEMNQVLNGTIILSGLIGRVGNSIRITVSLLTYPYLVRLPGGATLSVSNTDELFDRIPELVRSMQSAIASVEYEVTAQTMPDSPLPFLERGILFAMRRDYNIALMDFSDAIKLNPNLVSAYLLRGRALYTSLLFERGDLHDEKYAEVAVEENFSRVEIAYFYFFHNGIGEDKILDRAIEDFTQAIRLDPNNATAYNERGTVYLIKYDLEQALLDYNQAIRFDPNNAKNYSDRGRLFHLAEDNTRAIADFTQAISLQPDNANFYAIRGFLLLNTLEYYTLKQTIDRARADFMQAHTIGLDTTSLGLTNEQENFLINFQQELDNLLFGYR